MSKSEYTARGFAEYWIVDPMQQKATALEWVGGLYEERMYADESSIVNGKQNYRCSDCGRQFMQDPQNKALDPATKALTDKLLLERLSLAGMARVTGVSKLWLQR